MTDVLRALLAAAVLAASAVVAAPPADQGGVGTAIWSGKASFVAAKYGPLYLALPDSPRGTRVRIVGPGGHVVRTSNDVGPDQSIFPDRVADLSYADFEVVCGPRAHERGLGTCHVTVEWLGGAGATPPPTDT